MDLTKIDQPFGALDIETKLALHRANYEGEVIECMHGSHGKWAATMAPAWFSTCTYRVRLEPLRDISLPWAALGDRWQHGARDMDGRVWVYSKRPDLAQRVWTTDGPCTEITDLFANFYPGNKPWNESLIRRPEGA